MASGADFISGLPDGVREHVLSFLPAHEAVRSSLLSRSWRDLWKQSPALRITEWGTIDDFTSFVYGLLRARLAAPAAPLLSCHFDLVNPCFEQDSEDDDDVEEQVRWVHEALENSWIQDALKCNVQVLRAAFWKDECSLDNAWNFNRPVSKHLKELDLSYARLNEDSNHVVDFSGCPALLKLKMEYCRVSAYQMRSPSLEHLTMVGCYFFHEDECTLILPSLITLELTDCFGRKPLLEDFPLLTTAVVTLDHCCYDNWTRHGRHQDHHGECKCSFDVFFHALSNVSCMELSAPPDLFDFHRDIMPCPEFSKLKTLVLIDWFVADGLRALPWFLQYSPILERLTLEFSSEAQKSSEGTKRSCDALEQSVSSKHLKIVEIRCKEEGHGMILVFVLRVLASAPHRGQRNQDV
ncbi:hypothetical protein EJB05_05805, partial [Eragrostis curvula]